MGKQDRSIDRQDARQVRAETVEPVTQYGMPEKGRLTAEELQFIVIVKNEAIRSDLLERLQEIGELDAFLEIENETT